MCIQSDDSHHLGATLEVLGRLGQSRVAHQVDTILILTALLQKAFSVGLRGSHRVRLRVLVNLASHLRQVVPVDLELGDTGLLGENVPVKALDDGSGGRVLDKLRAVILHVDVVADAKELLAILVGAGE